MFHITNVRALAVKGAFARTTDAQLRSAFMLLPPWRSQLSKINSILLALSVVRAGSHFRSAAAAAARFSSADERRLARRRSGRVRGGRVRGADYQGDVIAC